MRDAICSKTSAVIGLHLFRGDSWQLMIGDARFALHPAFFIRAELMSRIAVDSRIVRTTSRIDTLPVEGLGTAAGSAFRLSGAALDSLARPVIRIYLMKKASFSHSACMTFIRCGRVCFNIAAKRPRQQMDVCNAAPQEMNCTAL